MSGPSPQRSTQTTAKATRVDHGGTQLSQQLIPHFPRSQRSQPSRGPSGSSHPSQPSQRLLPQGWPSSISQASSVSVPPIPKRPEAQAKQLSALRRDIDDFIKALHTVAPTFSFLPATHLYKTGPTEDYLGTAVHLLTAVESAVHKPETIVELLMNTTIKLPSFLDMQSDPDLVHCFQGFPGPVPLENDHSKQLVKDLKGIQRKIVTRGNVLYGTIRLPSVSLFGKSGEWHNMQNNDVFAINCYRPGNRRPHLPLKVKHPAFYEFYRNMHITPTVAQLGPLRHAATILGRALTVAVKKESDRVAGIVVVLLELFPPPDYMWTNETHVGGKGKYDLVCKWALSSGAAAPLIIVGVRHELGVNGDAYLQLCRRYDVYIASDPSIPLSGAPAFLLAISGPAIAICGGFAEEGSICHAVVDVDVFDCVLAFPDVAGDHQEKLAKILFALQTAVKSLPLTHSDAHEPRIPNIPVVFPTYHIFSSGMEESLVFDRPFDSRCSTFFATMPKGCMVKLAFRPYGYAVHSALQAAQLAPELRGFSKKPEIGADAIVMQYLPPPARNIPGWVTLHDLAVNHRQLVFEERTEIHSRLKKIVSLLKGLDFVHGDLRPNNLMIKVVGAGNAFVQPITVNVIDMEWAGKVGEAYYPGDRNGAVGYPGNAGGPIGADDDGRMVQSWWDEINKL